MSPQRTAISLAWTLLLASGVIVSGNSRAETAKPAIPQRGQPAASSCATTATAYDWDFAAGPQGFSATICDASGAPVWEYGATSYVPGAPGPVWGTILNGPYPNEAGAGLLSPAFYVSTSSQLVEVYHYFDTEWGYDGCNLMVRPAGVVLQPTGGYTMSAISASTAYYAWCVDGEPGWTGLSSGWRVDCFDLSAYVGQTVNLQFDFGSDASVTSAGWYISRVRIGGNAPPTGACCFGPTCLVLTAGECSGSGGVYYGDYTECGGSTCPQVPFGGCCFPSTGNCSTLTAAACAEAGGDYLGDYNFCPDTGGCSDPTGACCLGSVCLVFTNPDCAASGGVYYGDGTDCMVNPCPPSTGVCCFSDHSCAILTAAACSEQGGNYLGADFACESNPCGSVEPPRNVTAETLGPGQVRLSWDAAPSGDALYVDRKRGAGGAWGMVQILPVNATEWLDTGVVPGESYYYRVRTAAGAEVSLYSNFTITVVGNVPAAPSNVVAVAASPVRINISWADNSSFEAGFEIEGKMGEWGPWTAMKPDPPANSPSSSIGTLTPARDYRFRVRAYNSFGHSAWATSNACTTPLDPGNFNAIIRVRRGTELVAGATVLVDRGAGLDSAGVTNADGDCTIAGLRLNDRIRALWRAQDWVSCRDYTKFSTTADMGMHLTLDSDVMKPDGTYEVFQIATTESMYSLELVHPIFRFDLAFSTEWDIPAGHPYWGALAAGCQSASNYLYDASDGQMALGQIAVWDCEQFWGEVDVRIENDVWPCSDLDQFMDCDTYSANEHVYMPRLDQNQAPSQLGWYSTLVHELGHYILGLRDEYETGVGGQDRMEMLKDTRPDLYPKNHGIMDGEHGSTELSSSNDYVKNYNYPGCLPFFGCAMVRSEQLWDRQMPSWDWVEQKLEGYSSFAQITKPVYGTYDSGWSSSADRSGPTDDVGILSWAVGDVGTRPRPVIGFEAFDGGGGSFSRDVVVADGRRPQADARIYKLSGKELTYLGKTDLRGRLEAVGLKEGDALRTYARTPTGTWRGGISEIGGARGSRQIDLSLATAAVPGGRQGVPPEDASAPGAAVDVVPSGTADVATFTLHLWPDEPLAEPPGVIGFYASRVDTLPAVLYPAEGVYRAVLQFALADTAFDGTGLFEVSLRDPADNRSDFTVPFSAHLVQGGELREIYQGTADINFQPADVPLDRVVSGASSNVMPFRVPGFAPTPVGDIHSFHVAVNDEYPSTATLNIAYDDSLLAGLDERTLRIYNWSAAAREWLPIEGSHASTGDNVVSAVVSRGGVFCVFAESSVSDPVPPGRTGDFGAVGTTGLGAVQLLWTATGDDGDVGTAQDYIVAYADSAITDADWEGLPQIVISGDALPAGTGMTATINLPMPGHLYHLALKAKDKASNLSPLSNVTYTISGVADPNLLPAPPTNVRAVDLPGDNGGAVRVTWAKSYDDGGGKGTVTAYHIYRNAPPALVPDSLAAVPAGTTAFVDPAATSGVEYTYWVSAADGPAETFSAANGAFAARNVGVPVGDFSSDLVVGVNDLCLLAGVYGIDSSDVEFEPLFDLDHDESVSNADFQSFQSWFATGGVPLTSPAGENAGASTLYQIVPAGEGVWHLNLTLRGASNLAGYSFKVTYPAQTLTFLQAAADSGGVIPNILNRDGGVTPLFVLRQPESEPGVLYIANAIERPSTTNAPDGDGFLAQLTFGGSGIASASVSQIVLMDVRRLTNLFSAPTAVEDGLTILRPTLLPCAPNPFGAQTFLRFQVPGRQKVALRVFDVAGRRVRTLVDGVVEPGFHEVVWDGRSNLRQALPAGVYFYRFETPGYTKARKVVLLP